MLLRLFRHIRRKFPTSVSLHPQKSSWFFPFSFISAKLLMLLFGCLHILLILFLHSCCNSPATSPIYSYPPCSFCFSDRSLCLFVLHFNSQSFNPPPSAPSVIFFSNFPHRTPPPPFSRYMSCLHPSSLISSLSSSYAIFFFSRRSNAARLFNIMNSTFCSLSYLL